MGEGLPRRVPWRLPRCLPRRVLITGGKGQLGEELSLFLTGEGGAGPDGSPATGVAAFPDAAALPEAVWAPGRAELDITDLDGLRRAFAGAFGGAGPDLVIHTAAQANVDACELDPDMAYSANALGTRNVAVACREAGARLVYVSTDFVFDGKKGEGYTEFDPVNPLSVYGRSKLMGEEYVRRLLPEHYIARTSWLYGRAGRNNFVRTVLRLARERREGRERREDGGGVKMVADQTGGPTYTLDLARAIWDLAARPTYGTYHLSNGGHCSRYEFARRILISAGLADVPVTRVSTEEFPRPAPRPAFSVLDNCVWRLEGRAPLRPWDEALAEYVRFLYKTSP